MAKSGNRPPRSGGNRAPRSSRGTETAAPPPLPPAPAPAPAAGHASERARERLDSRATASDKHRGSAARARAAGPSARGRDQRAPSTARTAGIFGTALVLVAVVVIVAVSLGTSKAHNGSAGLTSFPAVPAPASVAKAVTSVPASALAAAGTGNSADVSTAGVILPLSKQPALKSGGKPELVYLGSEYCPYCAATRWGLTIALSRFGTFHDLKITKSSAYDVYPSTDTLSYHGATYTSPYLVFNHTEELTNTCTGLNASGQCTGYTSLESPSSAVAALLAKYDQVPYVSSNQVNGIPFIDFGGKLVQSGAILLPSVLAGASWQQIAADLTNTSSTIGTSVDASANFFTAAICKVTGGRPGSVCDSAVIQLAAKQLP